MKLTDKGKYLVRLRFPAYAFLRIRLHSLAAMAAYRPDYYGEMLRQHPEIDPETLMKIQ